MDLDLNFVVGNDPDPGKPSAGRDFAEAEFTSALRDVVDAESARARDETAHLRTGLDVLLTMTAMSNDAVEWASATIADHLAEDEEDQKFHRYYQTLVVLVDRGTTVAKEVHALLSAGFPGGAYARLRTLEELFVVAGLIAVHGNPDAEHPELVDSYLEHHKVFARALADELIATGNLSRDNPLLEHSTIRALEADRTRLEEKYGRNYRSLWGWAAPLFPPRTKLTFGKLSARLGMDLTAYNSMASRHVHASSEGWHEAASREDPMEPAGMILVMTTGYLRMLVEMVVPYTITPAHGSPDKTGEVWNDALHTLALRTR